MARAAPNACDGRNPASGTNSLAGQIIHQAAVVEAYSDGPLIGVGNSIAGPAGLAHARPDLHPRGVESLAAAGADDPNAATKKRRYAGGASCRTSRAHGFPALAPMLAFL